MTKRILIAGVGNIFMGDDAFGVETARCLLTSQLPNGVRVKDFGTRSFDLAYSIMDGYDAVILVDATPRGQTPGMVYLIEPELDRLNPSDAQPMNSHSMDLGRALEMAKSLGAHVGQIYLVGCEPEILETEGGYIGLSPKVQAAVSVAVELIQSLVSDIMQNLRPSLVEV